MSQEKSMTNEEMNTFTTYDYGRLVRMEALLKQFIERNRGSLYMHCQRPGKETATTEQCLKSILEGKEP